MEKIYSCVNCVFSNSNNTSCKLFMKKENMSGCVFSCTEDEFVTNERTQRLIIKSKKITINQIKENPIMFIEDITGKKLNFVQRCVLNKLFKDIPKGIDIHEK